MKALKFLMVLVLLLSMTASVFAAGPGGGGKGGSGGGKGGGGETEVAGNNLSYPVIWSEGVTKVLPGTAGMTPLAGGVWWYQWGTNGTDPNITPASCAPDPDEKNAVLNPNGDPFCDDNLAVSLTKPAGVPEADNPLPLVRAYVQKDKNNIWQAWNGLAATAGVSNAVGGVDVDWIDWGDNLESVDWYTRSQVRTEVVLFEDLPAPLLEYEMRHTSGWGIDEVHGMATDLAMTPLLGPGTRATVYSHCARLTIQKLLVSRDDPRLTELIWVPGEGWTEPEGYATNLINPHIFNGSVHEGGDGPGYYTAEINVKGRIIFGYTWNVRTLNDTTPLEGSTISTAAGDYRLTFSLDQQCGTATLKTHFVEGTTQIVVPIEEEEAVSIAAEDDGAGATPVLVPADFDENGAVVGGNLSYIDVHILARTGGGGGRPNSFEGGDCVCDCECIGKECNCICQEQCQCSCDCEGEDCACACEATSCAQTRTHVRTMTQQRLQLESQCPGDNCPCTDVQGNVCQSYQAQLKDMVKTMERMQLGTFCDGNGCQCICESGESCVNLRTELQTMLQTHEQLMTQCATGSCELDEAFFDSVEVEMTALAALFSAMDEEYQTCLPSVQQPD